MTVTALGFSDDDDLTGKRRERQLKQDWQTFHAEIDRLLDEIRPTRVGQGEYGWREPAYGFARNHMPDESNIIRNVAKQVVDRRETQATKVGNNLLRAWMHGTMPLSWSIVGPKPVLVDKIRVRLDIATPEDIDAAAVQLLSEGAKTYKEVQVLAEALKDLVRAARAQGYSRVADMGDLRPRQDDDPDDFWTVDPGELDWQ